MKNRSILILLFSFFFFLAFPAQAAEKNYVTLVFPVRGRDFWWQGRDLSHLTRLIASVSATRLPSTWLVQYDALLDDQIVDQLHSLENQAEKGVFLEVTRRLAEDSFVPYAWEHGPWTSANLLFLSGYQPLDRLRMIDKAFSTFKDKFGNYPKSFGAWYVDVASIEYIKQKYGAIALLGLADQYATDGYQTWGQYFSQPYFVSRKSAIEPAADASDNTGVIKLQWAPRDPVRGYGTSGDYSNFSVQVNDYFRNKGLDKNYFDRLLKTLTLDAAGPLSQTVIGIEAAELEPEYWTALTDQLNLVKKYVSRGLLVAETMSRFADIYTAAFPKTSPQITLSGSNAGTTFWWFNSPGFRLALGLENGILKIKDLRYYHYSSLRDNDQVFPDPNLNLTRVVPAVVDQAALGNEIILGRPSKINNPPGHFAWPGGSLDVTPAGPVINGGPPVPRPAGVSVPDRRCFGEYGGYRPPLGCLKQLAVFLARFIPDIRYSSLSGQKFLGLRIGPEYLWGLRFPKIRLGRFYFKFPLLENFISLRSRLTPDFSWEGKQEIEISSFRSNAKIVRKIGQYGHDSLLELANPPKIFENSYYLVFKP